MKSDPKSYQHPIGSLVVFKYSYGVYDGGEHLLYGIIIGRSLKGRRGQFWTQYTVYCSDGRTTQPGSDYFTVLS